MIIQFYNVLDLMSSAKMRELQQINLQLLRKQKDLQEELLKQQEAQKQVLDQLHEHGKQASINPEHTITQDIASIMQETTSRLCVDLAEALSLS